MEGMIGGLSCLSWHSWCVSVGSIVAFVRGHFGLTIVDVPGRTAGKACIRGGMSRSISRCSVSSRSVWIIGGLARLRYVSLPSSLLHLPLPFPFSPPLFPSPPLHQLTLTHPPSDLPFSNFGFLPPNRQSPLKSSPRPFKLYIRELSRLCALSASVYRGPDHGV